MYAEDNFTFCQKDLCGISFSAFEDMRKKGELCDVMLKVQDHSLTAHRVILAAAIPYFRSLFSGANEQLEERELSLDDLDPTVLESLIEFAYSSKVVISTANVKSLCLASQFFQLNQIRDACVEFMSKRLSINNIIQVREFAYSLDNATLTQSTIRFITQNFEEFCESSDFLSLPYSSVKEIIAVDELHVSSEEIVFRAVMRWVKEEPKERQDALPDLLSEVRLIFLPIDYLVEQVTCEELIISSKLSNDLIHEVKNYHLSPSRRSKCTKLKTVPRKYSNVASAGIYTVSSASKSKINTVSSVSEGSKDIVNCKAGSIYAVCQNSALSLLLYYCDFEKNKWQHVSFIRDNENVFRAVSVNQKLYLFLERRIVTFHQQTGAWEELKPRHTDIGGTAVSVYGDVIYFFGSHMTYSLNKLRCFDTQLNKWQREGRMEMCRQFFAASTLNKAIYITGGRDPMYNASRAVEMFGPYTRKWTKVSSMLSVRYLHCSCVMKEKMYVCGGIVSEEGTEAEVYDPVLNVWCYIAPIKMYTLHSLVPYKNRIFAFGHDDYSEKGAVTQIYDDGEGKWERGFPVPEQFRYAVILPAGNK